MQVSQIEGSAVVFSMVLIYMIVASWLTVRLRSKNSAEFMVGSRAVPAAVIGVLLMSEFIGAPATVGTAQVAFNSGIAAAWSIVSASVGFLLFGLFFVRKLYNSGEFTISGAISQKFGNSTKLTVSVIMIYALVLVNGINYIAGAAAISTIMHLSLTTSTFLIALIGTFYFAFGGFRGVAYVTVMHAAMKIAGVLLILAVAMHLSGGVSPMVQALPSYYFTWDGKIGVSTIVAFIIGNIGAIFSTQFIVQAISSNRNANDARRSAFYAAALCLPFGIAVGLIGVAAKFVSPAEKSLFALPGFMQSMSVPLAGIVTTSLVASVFVGVGGCGLAATSLVVRDFYVPFAKPTPEREFKMTRVISLIIGLLPLVFVFLFPEILKLSFFTRALRLSIAIVAVTGFYLPFLGSNRGATIGLIGAAVATTVWYLLGNPYGIDNMYVAAVTPAIVMVVFRLFAGPPHREQLAAGAVLSSNSDP